MVFFVFRTLSYGPIVNIVILQRPYKLVEKIGVLRARPPSNARHNILFFYFTRKKLAKPRFVAFICEVSYLRPKASCNEAHINQTHRIGPLSLHCHGQFFQKHFNLVNRLTGLVDDQAIANDDHCSVAVYIIPIIRGDGCLYGFDELFFGVRPKF